MISSINLDVQIYMVMAILGFDVATQFSIGTFLMHKHSHWLWVVKTSPIFQIIMSAFCESSSGAASFSCSLLVCSP